MPFVTRVFLLVVFAIALAGGVQAFFTSGERYGWAWTLGLLGVTAAAGYVWSLGARK